MQLFACIDAAKMPNILEVLAAEGIQHACLFSGKEAEDYGAVAPWIAEIPPNERILDKLFSVNPEMSALWQFDGAIFFQSTANFDGMRSHLRRLTKVPRVDNKSVFFRFWDPLVAHWYFSEIADWPDRLSSLLVSRHATVSRIIVPRGTTKSARIFDLSMPAGHIPSSRSLRLEERDLKILRDLQWFRLEHDLCAWMTRFDPVRFRGFDQARLARISKHAIREGRAFGLRYQEEFAYLLYVMTFLGGWFHRAPQFSCFSELFADPSDERFTNLTREFPDRHKKFFGHLGDPSVQMKHLQSWTEKIIAEAGSWDKLDAGHLNMMSTEIARRLGWGEEQYRIVEADAAASARDSGILDDRGIRLHHIIWMTLGPYFLHDPLYPWAEEKYVEASKKPDAIFKVASYGHRRLTRTISLQRFFANA
ncbi:DUF4123 domain-containing protein [uncultured Litoreibacter sp.]|uniref:DUF4123 domain-containing protein n=1 Tax=uncultured Litoreibacter sp. TaxID=1392394 RepID=UPI00262AFD4B|nr:DUF4123 domain-containing protein [uncultured Litoreibacter sp.]